MRPLLLLAVLLTAAPAPAPIARQTLTIKNLGAAPVTLLLQRPDRGYDWGPYVLAPHEELQLAYCPCAQLTLELRSARRERPLRYPLIDLKRLLLSEDRWSQGEPITVYAEASPQCPAEAKCERPAFKISR